jgi:hypothetical protein
MSEVVTVDEMRDILQRRRKRLIVLLRRGDLRGAQRMIYDIERLGTHLNRLARVRVVARRR